MVEFIFIVVFVFFAVSIYGLIKKGKPALSEVKVGDKPTGGKQVHKGSRLLGWSSVLLFGAPLLTGGWSNSYGEIFMFGMFLISALYLLSTYIDSNKIKINRKQK